MHFYIIFSGHHSLPDMKAAVELLKEIGAATRGIFSGIGGKGSGHVFRLPRPLDEVERSVSGAVEFSY